MGDITSIRITKTVKKELQEVALDKEPMHLTIHRLINENRQLKKMNEKNEELLELYNEKYKGYYPMMQFTNKVIDEYLENNSNITLKTYGDIVKIIYNDKPFDKKIENLIDVFESDCGYEFDKNNSSFIFALNYRKSLNLKHETELINAFKSYVDKNKLCTFEDIREK